jgi:hypothetical protein
MNQGLCKSAIRARKKRESQERARQIQAEISAMDSATDVGISPEKLRYTYSDIFPEKLTAPDSTCDLYIACVRCPVVGLIKYPFESDLGNKLGYQIPYKCSLITTVCRTCFNKYPGMDQHQLNQMMKSIKISSSHFPSGDLYHHLPDSAHVLTDGDAIAYVSLNDLNNNLDDTCVLKSMINTGDEYVAVDLKGGFF